MKIQVFKNLITLIVIGSLVMGVSVFADEETGGNIETGDTTAEANVENIVNTNVVDTEGEETQNTNQEPSVETENSSQAPNEETENIGGEGSEPDDSEPAPTSSSPEENSTDTASTDSPETVSDEESTDNNSSQEESADELQTEEDQTSESENPSDSGEIIENENSEQAPAEEENSEIDNSNEAGIENDLIVEATTGDNTASGTISTGDAVASANVLNLVNTNIINSEGLFLLLEPFYQLIGNFDLRQFYQPESSEPGGSCSINQCLIPGDLTITNTNIATLLNSIIVRSFTGGNLSNNGSINTGDAYAAANVVNVVNTNIVGSDYLLLTFNNIGDWFGDLLFPGSDFFANMFGDSSTTLPSSLDVTNSSEAVIDNSATVLADTGSNTASSTIQTGDAASSANVINQVNTNLLNSDGFTVLIRVHGDWLGNVFSPPEGISWVQTGSGIQFFRDGSSSTSSPSSVLPSQTEITNTNIADITNKVQVYALTGENKLAGDGNIQTGHAYASANIINVANTSVVGKNWILAIFNVFGNWTGNIAFGRPDLWIGESAKPSSDPLGPNSSITYTFSFRNNGDAYATNVVIEDNISEHIRVGEAADGFQVEENRIRWNVGRLEPGQAGSLSYIGVPKNPESLPYGNTPVTNSVNISSYEDDADQLDNSESLTLNLYRASPPAPQVGGGFEPWILLNLSKERKSASPISASSTVEYQIRLMNNGPGSAHDVVVTDEMRDPSGKAINTLKWDLGEVKSFEEVLIDYTVAVASNAPPGTYTNRAIASGKSVRGFTEYSNQGIASVEVVSPKSDTSGNGGSNTPEDQSLTIDLSAVETSSATTSTTASVVSIEAAVKEIKETLSPLIQQAAAKIEPEFPTFVPKVSEKQNSRLLAMLPNILHPVTILTLAIIALLAALCLALKEEKQ